MGDDFTFKNDGVEIYLNVDKIKEYYASKYPDEMKNKIKNMTDEEVIIKYQGYDSFEEYLYLLSLRGYRVEDDMSYKDFCRINNELPFSSGQYTEENYNAEMQQIRNSILMVDIYDPTNQKVEEPGWSYEVFEMGEYIYTVKVGEKEFKFKISIDQYEIIIDRSNAFAYDMKNDKFLMIESGTYKEENISIISDELISDDERFSSHIGNMNYWKFNIEEDSFVNASLICEHEIIIKGYIYILPK